MGDATKTAPDMGGIRVRTPLTWNHFPKMNGNFPFFWIIPIKKGEKPQGGVGVQKPRMPPWDTEYTIRIPIDALSLKIFKIKIFEENEWKNENFFDIDFWRQKILKLMEKKIMGIGWGLWHRKILRAPKYLNHQSPQPNPHTFFLHYKIWVRK